MDCEVISSNPEKYIVSTSLFRLYGGEYKNFQMYIDGLAMTAKVIQTELPSFKFRIYVDDTIINDPSVLNNLKSIRPPLEIVRFTCKSFIQQGYFHKDLFGTLIRFLPMFRSKKNNIADSVVLISDADWTPRWKGLRAYKTLMSNSVLKKRFHQSYVVFVGRLFHFAIKEGTLRRKVYTNKMVLPYCVATAPVTYKKMDVSIFDSFLRRVNSTSDKLTNYTDTRKEYTSGFVFGVDEYFINEVVLVHLINNRLSFGVRYSFSFMHSLFFFTQTNSHNHQTKSFSKEENKCLRTFFGFISKDKRVDITDMIAKLDSIYRSSSGLQSDEDARLVYRMYRFFILILTKPHNPIYDNIFPRWFVSLLLDDVHLPYYRGEIYRFYNPSFEYFGYTYQLPPKYIKRLQVRLSKDTK